MVGDIVIEIRSTTDKNTASSCFRFPRCFQLDRQRVLLLVQQMQQQRCQLFRCYQLDHLLAAGKLFAAQFTEPNVALDRFEYTSSILASHRHALPLDLTADPLGHRSEQIELVDVQPLQ